LEEYRRGGEVEKYVRNVHMMMAALQAESESLPTERQRIAYMLDVFERILLTARSRSCKCETRLALGCENVDIFHVMGEWLEYNRKSLGDLKS
jgi:hypothetical protein